jgi:hypothetical protein
MRIQALLTAAAINLKRLASVLFALFVWIRCFLNAGMWLDTRAIRPGSSIAAETVA